MDPDQARQNAGLDLDANCLLSADDKSVQYSEKILFGSIIYVTVNNFSVMLGLGLPVLYQYYAADKVSC